MSAMRLLTILGVLVLIAYPCVGEPVTFTRDIAPLLQRHCQDCHRPGQSAPMSLLTYAEARPWAKSIEQKVTLREMPPFHATGTIGRYLNDPRLTDAEIATIVAWVKSGAPQGNPDDMPEPRTWATNEWMGGTPDLVVKMPRYNIRSDGIDDNVDTYSEYVFPQDTWLRAVEVRPSNYKTLHHANVFLGLEDEAVPDKFFSHEMKKDLLARPFLAQWLPGHAFEPMPEGQAIQAFAGRRILVNAHYAPITETEFDETQIGLYFANGNIDTVLQHLPINVLSLPAPIEPNDSAYVLTFKREFESDVQITDFHFHMHYRGSSASISFLRPDGVVVPGIEVPRYNFNWQQKYTLAEPLALPKGTQTTIQLHWDNSAANPINPDPTQQVKFGILTTEEMGVASIWYLDPKSKITPPILVKNGLRVDTPQSE